jgi:hypothetical protein
VYKKKVHSQRVIKHRYPNYDAKVEKLEECLMLREGTAHSSHQIRDVYYFRHDDMPDREFYACRRFCHLTAEGAEQDMFGLASANENVPEEAAVPPPLTANTDEDVARFLAMGLTVDDDNMPAPENIPQPQATSTEDVVYEAWDSDVCCHRAKEIGRSEPKPTLVNAPEGDNLTDWFLFFLPWKFFKATIIAATNRRIDGNQITEGEFLRYLGIWLLLSTVHTGQCKRSFWKETEPNPFFGAPFRCNKYMSGKRFEKITAALKYTDLPRPSYVDRVHEVRQLLSAFNELMSQIFNAGWVVCLDESMSPWTNMRTCAAFVFCPRKPHPKGNEYHTIADGLSGILFGLELVLQASSCGSASLSLVR